MNGKVLNKEALKAWILSKMVTLTNNLLATTPGISAMDAAQGPVIQGQIDAINSNFGGLSFGMTEDGQPGFRKPGADTVYPFTNRKFSGTYRLCVAYVGNTSSYLTVSTLHKRKIIFEMSQSVASSGKLIIGNNTYTSSGTYDINGEETVTIKNDYINTSGIISSAIFGTYELTD